MKKGSVWVLAAAAILVVAVLYHSSPAQTDVAASTPKLAVVDVIKVLTECQENVDFRQASQEKGKKIREEREKLIQESDELKHQLENVLEQGSDGYKAGVKDWFQKQAYLKAYEESEKQVLSVESQIFMEALYRKMLDEVAGLARLEGYDLVIDTQDELLKPRSLTELEEMVRERKVLYHSASLDLTSRIIENLNRKYEAQKAAQG